MDRPMANTLPVVLLNAPDALPNIPPSDCEVFQDILQNVADVSHDVTYKVCDILHDAHDVLGDLK